MSTSEAWSVVSSVVSVILAILSIWLALYFFAKTKETEQEVTNSLSKIEAQTETLSKLSAKWMDRLTRYVTDDRPRPNDESVNQLVTVMSHLPQAIAIQISQFSSDRSQQTLTDQLLNSHVVLCYYAAVANYFAQILMPDAGASKTEFDQMVLRIVDSSAQDFRNIMLLVAKVEAERLRRCDPNNIYGEIREFWATKVRSATEVFDERARIAN